VDSVQYGTGAVFSLLPAQNATGNYIKIVQRVPVKLLFDDARVSQYLLAPGMSVEPSIVIKP
jgi:membrane fusion protein (multidrug efflux system)